MRRPPAARPVTAILLVGLAVEMLAGCAGNAFSEPARVSRRGGTVKIGFVAPLSGPFASLGHDMRRGFHLYLDRHEGRLGGRRVDLVDADEGAGPETGVPAVQRLVTRDRVAAVVGIVNSAVALGSRRTFVEARVPLIVATAGANALTGMQGSEFIWRTSFASADFNDAAGRWLARQPPVPGGVFLLAADFVAGREQIAGFKTAFTAGGGHIAGELYSPFGTTQDFQPYLAQVRASGAGAVYAFYAGEDAVNFVRQYRDFGLAGRIPLYGPGSLTEGPVLDAQGAAADGIITANNYSRELDTPENRDFVAGYETAFHAPATSYAVQAYDAAAVLNAVLGDLGADGDVTGAALVAVLARLGDIESPRGTWRFNGRRNPQQTVYLRQVRRQGGGYVNAVVERLGLVDPAASGPGPAKERS